MLGVVIGVVASGVLLTFLNRDPIAVQRNRDEKAKQQKEKADEQKKLQDERDKIINDPVAIQKREQKAKEMKEKMFSSLTQEEKKALEEYIDQKRNDGKTDSQIMKQAGMKAFLFLFFILIAVMFGIIGVFIIAGGDTGKIFSIADEGKKYIYKFIEWNFPRFGSMTQSSASQL